MSQTGNPSPFSSTRLCPIPASLAQAMAFIPSKYGTECAAHPVACNSSSSTGTVPRPGPGPHSALYCFNNTGPSPRAGSRPGRDSVPVRALGAGGGGASGSTPSAGPGTPRASIRPCPSPPCSEGGDRERTRWLSGGSLSFEGGLDSMTFQKEENSLCFKNRVATLATEHWGRRENRSPSPSIPEQL